MIRHAIAERRRGPDGAGDALRPLSARGRAKMRRAARGLGRRLWLATPGQLRRLSGPLTGNGAGGEG